MTPFGLSRARRPRWLVPGSLAAVAAVALVCTVVAWRVGSGPSDPVTAVAAPAALAVAPEPLALPEDPTILVFGDSWTYGSAAIVPTLGYAYLLGDLIGGQSVVDGVRGSGYLKPGVDGGSYGERIASLDPALDPDLVIVEGSINDRRLYPAGYREAVTAAWDALAAIYPDASIVVLGPAPQVLPVEQPTALIDADLAALAAERGWWYISPIADEWITTANYASVIDSTDVGRDHPSTSGHRFLAQQLAGALAEIEAADDVSADAG